MNNFGETKERRFYGVAKVRKADLISPSESQLMSYYIDYGYSNIEEVLESLGEEEMLREWYINTNFTKDYQIHREQENILFIDWSSEYESVDVISESDWNRIYKENYEL